jgi:hypothetical protein
MDDPHFPLYRRSANGLNWYRIDSPTEFTEVQHVGRRYVVHRVRALIYPERMRIAELIGMEGGHVLACGVKEFEATLTRCRP